MEEIQISMREIQISMQEIRNPDKFDLLWLLLGFQLKGVDSYWLVISCYSGVPCLSTGLLDLIWSQEISLRMFAVVISASLLRMQIHTPHHASMNALSN